ncbi:MAG: YigZ family protein [Clostridia bacterium]
MSENGNYFCVENEFSNTIVINKSTFITTLVGIESLDDAQKKLKIIAKKYSDATHNCYAVISNELGSEQKCSDNGEPQGTAGAPMLDVLKKKNIRMTLAVVTRYFGGIKLGANGLVGAYSSSVAIAVDKANIIEKKLSYIIEFDGEYGYYRNLVDKIESLGGQTIDIEFCDKVNIQMQIPVSQLQLAQENLTELSLGKTTVTTSDKKYCAYKLK